MKLANFPCVKPNLPGILDKLAQEKGKLVTYKVIYLILDSNR